MMDRRILFFFGVLAALMIGIAVYQANLPPALNGGVIEPPKPMPDFTLQSASGPVSLSDFRGKLVVVFFGFTNCTDVCPLTLAAFRQAFTELGDQAMDVQVLFISVDHRRDTPEVVHGYTSNFHPDFIGLAGSKQQIDQVTRDFGVYYELGEPLEGDDDHAHGAYNVEHTTTVQVLDRQGNLVLTWSYGMPPDKLASDLKVLLRK
jgi:protein SCO1